MRFSKEEITDLIKAWLAITLAFGIARSGGLNFSRPDIFIISGLTVGVAFLLHELGHKFVAQRFHLWAEFRADEMMLILAILMSFTGIVFAAPGAVIILGVANLEQYGKTAAAGPIVNITLALLFLTLLKLPPSLLPFGLLKLFIYGYRINAWLALFNLIPFGMLDGLKVMAWNRNIWLGLILTAGILSFIISP